MQAIEVNSQRQLPVGSKRAGVVAVASQQICQRGRGGAGRVEWRGFLLGLSRKPSTPSVASAASQPEPTGVPELVGQKKNKKNGAADDSAPLDVSVGEAQKKWASRDLLIISGLPRRKTTAQARWNVSKSVIF